MFGTSGIRGPFGETVTAELALSVGQALATETDNRVVVGRDPRHTGPVLRDALTAGLREGGVDVIDVGVAATPTIARSVNWQEADAGVAITASHNPPTDNGIKLWNPSGMAFDKEQRATIADAIARDACTPAAWDAVGEQTTWPEAATRHAEAIADTVTIDSTPQVIVDVGTGAGSVTVQALRALGCQVETLNECANGAFPARPSEPTAEHCQTLQAVVAHTDADLGVAHDGDADRMMAVDETGTFIPGDVLATLFGRQAVQATADPEPTVVVPLNTSLAVEDTLTSAVPGTTVQYTPVGDGYVAERAKEVGAVFGGEPSGAWIWPEETLCPDGPLAAARLVALVAQAGPLSELVAAIDQYPIRRESHAVADKGVVMEQVRQAAAAQFEQIDDRDGVRIRRDDGWLLIRPSGTEPVVRITAEARHPDRADALRDQARALLPEQKE